MPQALTDEISIEVLDTDGAIREAEEAVAGDTRASFFRKAGIFGAGLATSGVLVSGFPELAQAKPSKKQDVAILQFALTLEYLEAAFYTEALKSNFSGDTGRFAKLVQSHEVTHVKTIKGVLGKSAVKKPKFDFRDTTSNLQKFQQTSFALENTGVRAYGGQVTNILQKPVLKAAASIITVEARHASLIAHILGNVGGKNGVTPYGAFDRQSSKTTILRDVKKTKFIKS